MLYEVITSVGVAAMDSQLASVIVRADQLVKLADRALYAAKAGKLRERGVVPLEAWKRTGA